MKILLVGAFGPASTNNGMVLALKVAGHRVTKFPYRTFAPETMNAKLISAATDQDAVVVCKGFGGNRPTVRPEALRAIRATKAYWLPDSVEVVGGYACLLAVSCDVACATSLVSCNAFSQAGHPRVCQIFEGFDPEVFRPWAQERTRDVVHVGSEDLHRGALLDGLRLRGFSVETPAAWMKDLSRVYSESRIVLNFVRGEIFSDRVVLAMASGAFVLTELSQDIIAAFRLGHELGGWCQWWELPAQVEHWLSHPDEREAVAKAGLEAVQRYTWEAQMRKLVRAIEGELVADGAFHKEGKDGV